MTIACTGADLDVTTIQLATSFARPEITDSATNESMLIDGALDGRSRRSPRTKRVIVPA